MELVNVYWGNDNYAIYIGKTAREYAMKMAFDWFKENDHYFHLENFPPYQRIWGDEYLKMVDYGSHAHYLYFVGAGTV